MKILFLDVDGVLCMNAPDFGVRLSHFSQPALRQLARIVTATGAKIVVHSSWRCHLDKMALLNEALATVDLPPAFSKTKLTYVHEAGNRSFQDIRCDEILHWLYNWDSPRPLRNDGYDSQLDDDSAVKRTLNDKLSPPMPVRRERIEAWAVVDDLSLEIVGVLDDHFVRTHEFIGLKKTHADELISILGGAVSVEPRAPTTTAIVDISTDLSDSSADRELMSVERPESPLMRVNSTALPDVYGSPILVFSRN
jgi:hypothetical protein